MAVTRVSIPMSVMSLGFRPLSSKFASSLKKKRITPVAFPRGRPPVHVPVSESARPVTRRAPPMHPAYVWATSGLARDRLVQYTTGLLPSSLTIERLCELCRDPCIQRGLVVNEYHLDVLARLRCSVRQDSVRTMKLLDALRSMVLHDHLSQKAALPDALLKAGVVELVVGLLQHEKRAVRRAALLLSVVLSWKTHIFEAFTNAEFIPNLVPLLCDVAPQAGAIPSLDGEGETARRTLTAFMRIHSLKPPVATALRSGGAIAPLVALLHVDDPLKAEDAAAVLRNMVAYASLSDQPTSYAILSALAAHPLPRPRCSGPICYKLLHDDLRPVASHLLLVATASRDVPALEEAIKQGEAVHADHAELRRARFALAKNRKCKFLKQRIWHVAKALFESRPPTVPSSEWIEDPTSFDESLVLDSLLAKRATLVTMRDSFGEWDSELGACFTVLIDLTLKYDEKQERKREERSEETPLTDTKRARREGEMTSSYKQKTPLNVRAYEAACMLRDYPNCIPVICENDPRCDFLPVHRHECYPTSDCSTIRQFIHKFRKHIPIPEERAVCIVVNHTLPLTEQLVSTVYEKHKDEDGFLYMSYTVS